MAIESLLSRRNVVIGLAGSAAAGTVAVQQSGGAKAFAELLRPSGKGSSNAWLAKATWADWETQIGANFTANTGQVLKLIDIQRFPADAKRPKNLRDRAFVARFDIVRGGQMAPDTIYRVNHRRGAFDIFLSKGDPEKPRRMLAVFN
jgi:hypothetical protein